MLPSRFGGMNLKWFKGNVINLYVVGSITVFIIMYHLQNNYMVGTNAHNRVTTFFFTFCIGIVILSGIGLRRCIDRFEKWYEKTNSIEQE